MSIISRLALAALLAVAPIASLADGIDNPTTSSGSPSGSAGGDLGGTYPNPTVTNLSHVTNASLANSGLANTGTTVNGQTCTLGGTCTVTAAASGVTVGTTTVGGGTTTRVLFDNAGVLGEYTATQLTALINVATASLSGALPAWPGNTTTFFRGDGSYQTLNCAALSNGAASCSTDATNAANISSGTLPSSRISGSYTGLTGTGTLTAGATGAGFTIALGSSTITGVVPAANGGAGTINGALKGNGSGAVSQAACADLSNAGTGCSAAVTTVGTASVGQIPGTTTNDNASAGNVGEVISSIGQVAGATVTISNASPAVITDSTSCATGQTSGCIGIGQVVSFTTTGALPAGLSAGTNYYVLSAGYTPSTSYQVATTPFGTPINTTNAGSGVQTRNNSTTGVSSGSYQTLAAVSLTAGQWGCTGATDVFSSGITTQIKSVISPTNNSTTGQIQQSSLLDVLNITGTEVQGSNGPIVLKLSGTTTYYLIAEATYSTGSSSMTGSLVCVRSR